MISTSPLRPQNKISLDDLAITLRETNREIAYTNKEAGHYYTWSHSPHSSGWQGWTVMDIRILDDYQILLDSSDLLRNRNRAIVTVKPHAMRRTYPDGVSESFTMLDSLNALVVDVFTPEPVHRMGFYPRFTHSRSYNDYRVGEHGTIMTISLRSYDERSSQHPGWIAVSVLHTHPIVEHTVERPELIDSIELRTYAPAGMVVPNVANATTIRWVIVAGKTEAEAKQLSEYVLNNAENLINNRRDRMQRLLDTSYIYTDNDSFNRALAWARLSMDKLIMNQTGKGIYAGLPWFNNYWGRDTFISFSGGVLVTGQLETAREILRSFARLQDTDPLSRTYGRIPNRVTTHEIIYNTTDGTPWFVRELWQYFLYSNDTAFVCDLYPTVRRSIEGAIKNFVDENYFLTHGDAETWMDAVGPEGPWSPRGDRAVDIQYLWYRQLLDGAQVALIAGDDESAAHWKRMAQRLRENFNAVFVDPSSKRVYDRIKADGTPDPSVRPNQIFAFDMIDDDTVRVHMLRTILGELTYPWGVASLAQSDTNFHPYHHHLPYYVPDAAYHNGIVWTWLIGRVIEASVKYDLQDIVYKVTDNMVHQILNRGGVGTFSELLDAFPREGEAEPRLSGTFTQAWNLAEFIRSAYQDYLGLHVNIPSKILSITPKIPSELGHVEALIPFLDGDIVINIDRIGDETWVQLHSREVRSDITVHLQWVLGSGDQWHATGVLNSGGDLTFALNEQQVTISPGTGADFVRVDDASRHGDFSGLTLAEPTWKDYWVSMKGPDHPLMTNDVVKQDPAHARLLYDVEDDVYDDTGPHGTYVYPTNPHFKPGILDITRFTVWADENNTYFRLQFRNLHDPGFHPHYGFQLTYAAILIDRGKEGPGLRDAGVNSLFTIDRELGTFDRAIYVGGGLRVVDGEKTILCEYIPALGDVVNPLGNVTDRAISFSIPNKYLGEPSEKWRYLVLVGAQDDHGGAGLGVFRDVLENPGEWHGGGRQKPDDPNVYDMILPGDS